MNDHPRQKLCELIAKYGESLSDESRRLEGLLRDLCGPHRLETNLLISALKEGIATDLRRSSVSIPIELLIARLSKRLEEHLGLNEQAARWSVESWALALGRISLNELNRQKPCPPPIDVLLPTTATSSRWSSADQAGNTNEPPVSAAALPPKSRSNRLITFGSITFILGGLSIWLIMTFQSKPKEISAPSQSPSPALTATKTSPTPTPYSVASAYSPTPSTTAPTNNDGNLLVSTDPSGATVFVDGTTVGTSQTFVSHMSIGQHHLKITLEGYEPEERYVNIKSGETATTGQIALRRQKNPFDGEWVGQSGWKGILRVNGQAATLTLSYTETMKPKADHWSNFPAPYNKLRTLSYQWRAESKSVRVSSTELAIYWNEWNSQGNVPLSVLKKLFPHSPGPRKFNAANPPTQDWGFVPQGSTLVSGEWTFRRKY